MNPRWMFDPENKLASLADESALMPPPDVYADVDGSIRPEDVPAEVEDLDPVTLADRAWWKRQTRHRCPAGVPIVVYRGMCDAAGLGPVGFVDGFDPDPSDWPGLDDVPLPTWADPLLADV